MICKEVFYSYPFVPSCKVTYLYLVVKLVYIEIVYALWYLGAVSATRSIVGRDNVGPPIGLQDPMNTVVTHGRGYTEGPIQRDRLQQGQLDENLNFCQENVTKQKIGFLLGGLYYYQPSN